MWPYLGFFRFSKDL